MIRECLVLGSGWLICAGGWIFGTGRFRKGFVFGGLGLAGWLVDYWIFR